MEIEIWKVFASLGVPGITIGVFYMLFRGFHWKFPSVPSSWVGPIVVLFMLIVGGLTFYALTLWAPIQNNNVNKSDNSSVKKANFTIEKEKLPSERTHDENSSYTSEKPKILDGYFLAITTWDGGRDYKELSADIDADGIDEVIRVGLDNPNGIKILFINGEAGTNLGSGGLNSSVGIEAYGELESGYYVQVAVKDVTNDGKPEILVGVGDGIVHSHILIFQYVGQETSSTGRPVSFPKFEQIFSRQGQTTIRVKEAGFIEFPYGSFGVYDLFKWDGNKFMEVSTELK